MGEFISRSGTRLGLRAVLPFPLPLWQHLVNSHEGQQHPGVRRARVEQPAQNLHIDFVAQWRHRSTQLIKVAVKALATRGAVGSPEISSFGKDAAQRRHEQRHDGKSRVDDNHLMGQ